LLAEDAIILACFIPVLMVLAALALRRQEE
jgi:hypothetical protein